ncbi:hypothetical protein HHI36_012239 [Cryptolaemus montrouzieri]|uniref:THAP-type domain-containing protein n=1 Tax=Cryptolaemus montrouzieri TaxID=559131 RepID=A0ABD2NEH1_9CUCU
MEYASSKAKPVNEYVQQIRIWLCVLHLIVSTIAKEIDFPSDEVERKRWIALLRREDKQPSRYSLVCSCHFIDKDRNNRPTLLSTITKRFSDLSSVSGPKAKKSNIQILEDELSMPLLLMQALTFTQNFQ